LTSQRFTAKNVRASLVSVFQKCRDPAGSQHSPSFVKKVDAGACCPDKGTPCNNGFEYCSGGRVQIAHYTTAKYNCNCECPGSVYSYTEHTHLAC